MKATELMIGDWVKVKGTFAYDKVQEIAIDENMQWYISFACSTTLFHAYEFEPIPLTTEILEKNGFVELKLDEGSSTILWEYYPWNIEYDITYDEYYGMRGEIKIEYVHQLQHILRLYGENELADNFKI